MDAIKYLSIYKNTKNCDMLTESGVFYWSIGQLLFRVGRQAPGNMICIF